MEGRLKSVLSKGYGFIDKDGIDFFFHHSEYDGKWDDLLTKFVGLNENEVIILSFKNDLEAPQGPRALNVKFERVEKLEKKK